MTSQSIQADAVPMHTHRRLHTTLPPYLRYVATQCVVRHYLVFVLLTSLYLLPFMWIMLPHSNEGSIIYGAERIVNGDVFARDFFEVMGPGSFYIAAVFLKVFGVTFFATRIWLFCSSMGIAVSLYFLARRVCARNATLPTLIVAGTWFGMQWPSISHHVDSNLFTLLAVVCLVLWEERSRIAALYGAGTCTGLVIWIHQSKGALLILVILAWCGFRVIAGHAKIATACRVALGVLLVNVAACVYFLSQGALRALFVANIIWPAKNYSGINLVPYGFGIFSEYWRHWAVLQGNATWWSIAFACILIIPFLTIAALPILLLIGAHIVKWQATSSTALLCLLAGWAMWLSELHRMDIYHLAFGSPLLLTVCLGILSNSHVPFLRIGLQVIAICSVCLMTANLLQAITSTRANTRVGSVGLLGSDALLKLIDANAQPGEDIFVYPDCPSYYFLSATTNPTRFSLLIYNYNPTTEFRQVIDTLDRRRVRLVVWDSAFQSRMGENVFPGAKQIAPTMQIMEPYLRSRYKQIGIVEGFRVLLRNE